MKKLTVAVAILLAVFFAATIEKSFAETEDNFAEKYAEVKAELDAVEKDYLDGASMRQLKRPASIAFQNAVTLYRRNMTSADACFLVARGYLYINNPLKAKRSLDKVFYYDRGHIGGYMLRGDVRAREAINEETDDGVPLKLISDAKRAYSLALKQPGLTKEQESYLYLRLGDLFYELRKRKSTAKEYWAKAKETAPESDAGMRAAKKLAAL